ncbi:SLC13 family permease [Vibrio lentus]|uniref:Transporter n=1 Tax=Vibrio lentus TaxID=136468 RepID=A0A2N7KEX0_9VIBR|nr:SLC13 family permease [Vibrio lentus]PMM74221.1 transporter [Vibrio lentus]
MPELFSAYLVFGLFIITIAALIRFQSKPERVFGVLLLSLYALNLVSTEQVVASFANQGVLTLVLLMICSLALEKTRLLRAVANFVIRPSYRRTWLNLFVFSALSSSVLNNTAVVSTMLAPIKNNAHHPASKLLIPLSYAAILGGTLTLVGTSTNLIVNSMVIEAGFPAIGFFDFTLLGSALVICSGMTLFVCSRWLPHRTDKVKAVADYFIDTKVMPGSSLIGRSVEANGLRNLESLFLVEVQRSAQLISPVTPSEIIQEGDRLLFSGDIKKVTLLEQFSGLKSFAHQNGLPLNNLSEVIVRPESVLIDKTLKRAGFRALFDAAVVAIKRDGEPLSGKLGDVTLKAGDYLILAVGDDFKARHNIAKNFYLISGVETEQTLSKRKEWLAVGGFICAIGLAAMNIIPLFQGMLMLLGALVFSKTLNTNEILQRLPTQIWLIIASALLLSYALTNSSAPKVFDAIIDSRQGLFTPFIGLCVIYISTWWLTELVTNNAAAALMFPIALGIASGLEIDPTGYIMAVAFGASASFISPYGYQTNLMVFNAGQYRILDFIKVGLPVSLVYSAVTLTGLSYTYAL